MNTLVKVVLLFSLLGLSKSISEEDEYDIRNMKRFFTYVIVIIAAIIAVIIFGCILVCFCLGKCCFSYRARSRAGVVFLQPGQVAQPTGNAAGSVSPYPPTAGGATIPPPYTATEYPPQYKS